MFTNLDFHEIFSYSLAIYPNVLTYTTNCDLHHFNQLWEQWTTDFERLSPYYPDFSDYLKRQGYDVIVSTPIVNQTYIL